MKKRQKNNKYVKGLLSVIALFICWELVSMMIKRAFFPGPEQALAALGTLIRSKEFNIHILSSMFRICAGTIAGFSFALPLGLSMGYVKQIDSILSPILYLLYPIPKVVFLPVIIVAFGLGDMPKIFLIAIVLVFQLAVVIRDSAKSLPKEQIDAMRSLNATKFQTLRHLILPGCLPGIMTSLKAGLGTSTALLFIAEMYASFSGLGYYIMLCMDAREYEDMYAGIIALAMLGCGLYVFLEQLERKVCSWNFK